MSELNLAIIHSYLGNRVRSESYFEQASEKLMISEDVVSLSAGMYDFAFSIRREQPSKALQIAKQANQLIQQVSDKVRRIDIKRGILSKFQDLNNLIIELDNNLSTLDALILAESVRAKTFDYQTLSSSQEIMPTTRNKISMLTKRLVHNINQARLANKTENRKHHFLQLRDISERIYDVELLTQKRIEETQIAFNEESFSELQNRMNDDDLVMFIDVGKSATHIWFIDSIAQSYIKAQPADFIDEIVADISDAIDTKHANPFESHTSARRLSEELFPHFILTKLKSKKRLIIIPDGSLASIPFSTLPIKNIGRLGDHVSIAHHHSLNLLLKQQQKTIPADEINSLLLVAAPTFNIGNTKTDPKDLGFVAPELPFSEIEAIRIAENPFTKTVSLLNSYATKSAFLNQPLHKFNTIHFATHGITNNYIPELGGLVFSNADNSENLLLAPEIKRLNLDANLVVLSGCETTTGVQVAGEGLLSLSRAFMQGGAQNVIGSLWKVQDDATAVLMSKFYEYKLSQKMSTSSALSEAQRFVKNYRRKDGKTPWVAPFYWAGFVLHGTGD